VKENVQCPAGVSKDVLEWRVDVRDIVVGCAGQGVGGDRVQFCDGLAAVLAGAICSDSAFCIFSA
jgi:hypothetical protein